MIDFAVSALCGALAGCGVGGGSLLLLYLTAAKNLPYMQGKQINLLFFIVCAAISLVFHIKDKLVCLKNAAVCALCGILTCLPAAVFSAQLSGELMKKIFGALFILVGLREVFAKSK